MTRQLQVGLAFGDRYAPVNDTRCLVEIFNRIGDLANDVSAEILAKVCQSNDLMEKLASGAELENNVVVLSRLGEVDQFGDVGVI